MLACEQTLVMMVWVQLCISQTVAGYPIHLLVKHNLHHLPLLDHLKSCRHIHFYECRLAARRHILNHYSLHLGLIHSQVSLDFISSTRPLGLSAI